MKRPGLLITLLLCTNIAAAAAGSPPAPPSASAALPARPSVPLGALLKTQAEIARIDEQLRLEQRKNELLQLQSSERRLGGDGQPEFSVLQVACGSRKCTATLSDGMRTMPVEVGNKFDAFTVTAIQATGVSLRHGATTLIAYPATDTGAPAAAGTGLLQPPPPLPVLREGGPR